MFLCITWRRHTKCRNIKHRGFSFSFLEIALFWKCCNNNNKLFHSWTSSVNIGLKLCDLGTFFKDWYSSHEDAGDFSFSFSARTLIWLPVIRLSIVYALLSSSGSTSYLYARSSYWHIWGPSLHLIAMRLPPRSIFWCSWLFWCSGMTSRAKRTLVSLSVVQIQSRVTTDQLIYNGKYFFFSYYCLLMC